MGIATRGVQRESPSSCLPLSPCQGQSPQALPVPQALTHPTVIPCLPQASLCSSSSPVRSFSLATQNLLYLLCLQLPCFQTCIIQSFCPSSQMLRSPSFSTAPCSLRPHLASALPRPLRSPSSLDTLLPLKSLAPSCRLFLLSPCPRLSQLRSPGLRFPLCISSYI